MKSEFASAEKSCWLLANINEINRRYSYSLGVGITKPVAVNSTALGDSKFISILRQSKQKTQFIEICLESQKTVCEKIF